MALQRGCPSSKIRAAAPGQQGSSVALGTRQAAGFKPQRLHRGLSLLLHLSTPVSGSKAQPSGEEWDTLMAPSYRARNQRVFFFSLLLTLRELNLGSVVSGRSREQSRTPTATGQRLALMDLGEILRAAPRRQTRCHPLPKRKVTGCRSTQEVSQTDSRRTTHQPASARLGKEPASPFSAPTAGPSAFPPTRQTVSCFFPPPRAR